MPRPELPNAVVYKILALLPPPVLSTCVKRLNRACYALVTTAPTPGAAPATSAAAAPRPVHCIIQASHPELPLWAVEEFVRRDSSGSASQEQLEKLQECRAAAGDLAGVVLLQQHGVSSPRALLAGVKAGHVAVVDHLLLRTTAPASSSTSLHWDRQVLCHTAARHGQLRMLQHLRMQLNCPWDAGVCAAAAAGGHQAVLEWLRAAGCAWCPDTAFEAAINNHLGLLQWAIAAGCPCDAATARLAAAIKGHFEVLVWLRGLEEPRQAAAGRRGSSSRQQLVQWLRQQGA